MSPLKNIFFMATSTGIRLVFGLVTFSVLARQLGPTHFGTLMLWLSVATLAALATNFGFGPYVLRAIGLQRDHAQPLIEDVLSAKLMVIALAVTLSCFSLIWMDGESRRVFGMLMGMQLADSITEYLNVGYRATNRFASETRIATISSVIQFAIVVTVSWYWPSTTTAAAALLGARAIVLVMTWVDQRRHMPGLKPGSIQAGLAHLRASVSYASDFVLQSLLGLIDSPILNHYMGPVAVGMHQAGMRLFLGGNQMSTILGNVFIPRLAHATKEPAKLQREGGLLQTAYLLAGLGFGLTLAIGAAPITHLMFGQQYAPLAALLPWFGLLFFLRFVASAFGVLLTAAGAQNLRTKANLVHWVLILLLALVLIPRYQNTGWLVALSVGNLVLIGFYFAGAQKMVRFSLLNAAIAFVGISTFLPWLTWPHS